MLFNILRILKSLLKEQSSRPIEFYIYWMISPLFFFPRSFFFLFSNKATQTTSVVYQRWTVQSDDLHPILFLNLNQDQSPSSRQTFLSFQLSSLPQFFQWLCHLTTPELTFHYSDQVGRFTLPQNDQPQY